MEASAPALAPRCPRKRVGRASFCHGNLLSRTEATAASGRLEERSDGTQRKETHSGQTSGRQSGIRWPSEARIEQSKPTPCSNQSSKPLHDLSLCSARYCTPPPVGPREASRRL